MGPGSSGILDPTGVFVEEFGVELHAPSGSLPASANLLGLRLGQRLAFLLLRQQRQGATNRAEHTKDSGSGPFDLPRAPIEA